MTVIQFECHGSHFVANDGFLVSNGVFSMLINVHTVNVRVTSRNQRLAQFTIIGKWCLKVSDF